VSRCFSWRNSVWPPHHNRKIVRATNNGLVSFRITGTKSNCDMQKMNTWLRRKLPFF